MVGKRDEAAFTVDMMEVLTWLGIETTSVDIYTGDSPLHPQPLDESEKRAALAAVVSAAQKPTGESTPLPPLQFGGGVPVQYILGVVEDADGLWVMTDAPEKDKVHAIDGKTLVGDMKGPVQLLVVRPWPMDERQRRCSRPSAGRARRRW